MTKQNFQLIIPVFSVTWFFRIHFDLVLIKHFLLSMLKKVVLTFV